MGSVPADGIQAALHLRRFCRPSWHLVGSGAYAERTTNHLQRLRAGKHNTLFQAAADHYGLRTVRFELLQLVPNGISASAMEEREYSVLASYIDAGWSALNILLPPTKPGRRFSIGPGGKWPWATKRKAKLP